MPLELALEYINHRLEKAAEDRLYQRWIAGPQFSIGFDEFKTELMPKRSRPDEEILDEVLAKFKKAGIE